MIPFDELTLYLSKLRLAVFYRHDHDIAATEPSGKPTSASLFSWSSHSNTSFCGFGYFFYVELSAIQFKS